MKTNSKVYVNKNQLATGFYFAHHDTDLNQYQLNEIKESFENKSEDSFDTAKNKIKEDLLSIISKAKPPVTILMSGGVDSTLMYLLAKECFIADNINVLFLGYKSNSREFENVKNIINYHYKYRIENITTSWFLPVVIDEINSNNYKNWFYSSSLIPTYAAYNEAKRHGNSIITGDGADELFCGYDRYIFANRFKNIRHYFGSNIIEALSTLSKSNRIGKAKRFWKYGYQGTVGIWDYEDVYKLIGYPTFNCSEWYKLIDPIPINYLDKLMHIDIVTELYGVESRKIDTAKRMAGNPNVVSPFLDLDLTKYCCSLPIEYKYKRFTRKYLLRKLIKDHLPKYDKIVPKRKKGFSVPIGQWLMDKKYEKYFKSDDILNSDIINKVYRENKENKKDHSERLWSIFVYKILREKGILEVV